MVIENPSNRGKLLKRIFSQESDLEPTEWILGSPDAEVYFVPERGLHDEPEFYMATSDNVLIKFAYTGDMTSIHKITRRNGEETLETVVEMDTQHHFHLYRNQLPVDGILDDASKPLEQLLESLVNYAYEKAESAKDPDAKGMALNFQALTYDAIVARFKLLQTIRSSTDIIPDQNPRTIFVKSGDGCPFECAYCPESASKFVPYSEEEFVQHLETTKRALTDILGEKGIRRMDEGFINISDILLLDISKKTDLTSVKALRHMRNYFPWLAKIGSFVGSQTALKLSEVDRGTFSLNGRTYSPNFLKSLKQEGLNRFYLGIETADDEGSYLLNKIISYEEKKTAAKLIQQAGIRLKAIIQIGVLGRGFYPLGKDISPENFVSYERAVKRTARWLNEVRPYRVYLSVWQNYGSLPINKLIEEGRIVMGDNPAEQVEKEKRLLSKEITFVASRIGKHPVEQDYEQYLPGDPSMISCPDHKPVRP